jgi:uncharacterized protein YbjT (DUF2867 family)
MGAAGSLAVLLALVAQTTEGFVGLAPHARARFTPALGDLHSSGQCAGGSAGRPRARGGAAELWMAAVGKTLVLGATGKVGGMVVRQLAAEGTPVLALARSIDSAAAKDLEALANVEVREGDVTNLDSLKSAASGCENLVAAYGMNPPRFVKISDIWRDPFDDPRHPANINFKGMENVVAASKAAGVKKVVRLTGLSVGLSPWNPISILFSIVLSFSNMWNRRGEQVLRDSGLDYTVVRPGGLKDVAPAHQTGERLLMASESWGEDAPPPTTGISRADVASLLCLSLSQPCLSRTTLRVNRVKPGRADNNYYEDPRGKATWEEMLDTVTPDVTPLQEVDYSTPVGVVLTAVAAAVGYAFGFVLGRVLPFVKASCGF